VGVSFSSSLTLPRVVAGISAGTTVLALAGVVTAAVLIFTASLAVLWPLLIGCACVAAIGLVIFAIAGHLAWHRKALAKENEGTGTHDESEKNNIIVPDHLEGSNSLKISLSDNQNVAPKATALVVTIGQSEESQVSPQVVICVRNANQTIPRFKMPLNDIGKITYSEFELTLTAKDEFLSTLKSDDTLCIRGDFCDLSLGKSKKINWNGKQNIKLRFCGKFIIDKNNFLRNEDGVLCQWKFFKNNRVWETGPFRVLRLQNSPAE
jgi:hypothetical protein